MKLEVEISADETCHTCGIGFPIGFRRIHMNDGFIYHEGCLANGRQEGLDRDHWLVSGRIDGIREALEIVRSGISRHEFERLLEERLGLLMNQKPPP